MYLTIACLEIINVFILAMVRRAACFVGIDNFSQCGERALDE